MKQLFLNSLKTDSNYAYLIMRLALGIMILPHGAQKMLGLFGGQGFNATMQHFTDGMGIPWIFALAAILAEFLGGIALILGALTRVAALNVGVVMGVALIIHFPNGFFMNWFGNQKGEGFEFHILALGLAIALTLTGGGKFSADRIVSKK